MAIRFPVRGLSPLHGLLFSILPTLVAVCPTPVVLSASLPPPTEQAEEELPEDLDHGMRKIIEGIALGQLREAKVSEEGIAIFQQHLTQAMALVPITELVTVETTVTIPLLPDRNNDSADGESIVADGELNFTMLFNAAAISSLYQGNCRHTLPRMKVADRSKAEPVCTSLALFAPPESP
jgi:hypothetical protein